MAFEDIEWCDDLIKQGQQVFLLLGAANRDQAEFPNPDSREISRESKRHMSFGRGIYHWPGRTAGANRGGSDVGEAAGALRVAGTSG
jgi:cytochrome P450